MPKFAITNALVFDGDELRKDRTVIIEDGLIASDETNAEVIDASGMTLLPGLIDAHVHVAREPNDSAGDLSHMAKCGVTTALDMGHLPPDHLHLLQGKKGLADIRFASTFATSTGATHSKLPGATKINLIDNTDQAVEFVQGRVAEGADYIKLIADIPGPTQEVLNTLAAEARKHGKLSIAHAARHTAYGMAQEAKVDIVTHVPIEKALTYANAQLMAKESRASVPTLAIAEALAGIGRIPGSNYPAAKESVTMLHRAGVPVLAGTDSNHSAIAPLKHGETLHHELELLVEAGLSNIEALRAATSLPAKYFRLGDRGIIEPGKRADLVLVAGNPLEDIKATKAVKRVWLGGEDLPLEE